MQVETLKSELASEYSAGQKSENAQEHLKCNLRMQNLSHPLVGHVRNPGIITKVGSRLRCNDTSSLRSAPMAATSNQTKARFDKWSVDQLI